VIDPNFNFRLHFTWDFPFVMVLHGVSLMSLLLSVAAVPTASAFLTLWFGLDFWLFCSDVENPWDMVAL